MKPLFIFEMANNHMGDVAHGVATIQAFKQASAPFESVFDFAFKLQYRDLDTFIHPSMKGRHDVKHIKRFEETRLSNDCFASILQEMNACGFRAICTPFDEPSVARIEQEPIDTIKIASCSFTDWPLLERIATVNKPVIASTAGATLEDIDNVVSFFRHRAKAFTLMHCVAEYPTPDDRLELNQIALLKQRYPDIQIGYSTHESPSNTTAVGLAYALGARVFEKHVVLANERYNANAYSATPEQVAAWLAAAAHAVQSCGHTQRLFATDQEKSSLHELRRGAFMRGPVRAGQIIQSNAVFFAFPPQPGQVTANEWSKYTQFIAARDIADGEALTSGNTQQVHQRTNVLEIVSRLKESLADAAVVIPSGSELEISHHYGLDRFHEFGLSMFTVVNREYCKKLLVVLPGQAHPEQHHLRKEETFFVLHGDLRLSLDGVVQVLGPGDVVTVLRGVKHHFSSDSGAIIEEISSTHDAKDSYYTDSAIMGNPNRKTKLTYWR